MVGISTQNRYAKHCIVAKLTRSTHLLANKVGNALTHYVS